jgi:hypothetical protein
LKNQLHEKAVPRARKSQTWCFYAMPKGYYDKYCSSFLEEYFRNNKDFHRRKEKKIKNKITKSLLPKAWQKTFVQKAPLVGFEKKKRTLGDILMGAGKN